MIQARSAVFLSAHWSRIVTIWQVGLGIMQRDGQVMQCHCSIHDAIWHAELGSSASVLKAGYGLDCLMLRYQVCALTS